MLTNVLLALLFLAAYGYTRRDAGGGWPHWSSTIPRLAQTVPFVILGYMIGHAHPFIGNEVVSGVVAALIAFVPTFLTKITGMGQYIGVQYPTIKHLVAEKIDVLVRPFFGADPRACWPQEYADRLNLYPPALKSLEISVHRYGKKKLTFRNIFGFTVLGLFGGIGLAGLLFTAGLPLVASVFLLFAATQGMVYWYCWDIFRLETTKEGGMVATEYAEFFTNVLLGIGLILVYIWLQ